MENVKTLKGRPIGLKYTMTENEMFEHLKKLIKSWSKEGFSSLEIKHAILAKTSPLVYGFYWHSYPEASQILSRVLKKLFSSF